MAQFDKYKSRAALSCVYWSPAVMIIQIRESNIIEMIGLLKANIWSDRAQVSLVESKQGDLLLFFMSEPLVGHARKPRLDYYYDDGLEVLPNGIRLNGALSRKQKEMRLLKKES